MKTKYFFVQADFFDHGLQLAIMDYRMLGKAPESYCRVKHGVTSCKVWFQDSDTQESRARSLAEGISCGDFRLDFMAEFFFPELKSKAAA